MSYSPATPSLAELVHQLVSIAVHDGGWTYVDGLEGGVPLASWPQPTANPPALIAGDLAVIRAPVVQQTGGGDVLCFSLGMGTLTVLLVRKNGGLAEAWDAGAHTPALGASTVSSSVTPLNPGDFGDVVFVDDHGVGLVQIVAASSFASRKYWGYLRSCARLPDGSGAEVGEQPVPYPFGAIDLDTSATASTLVEVTHFIEGDAILRSVCAVTTPRPTVSRSVAGALVLHPLIAENDLLGGLGAGVWAEARAVWWADMDGSPFTLTLARDSRTQDEYLAFGGPANMAVGPLYPRGKMRYRVLRYGGPPVP